MKTISTRIEKTTEEFLLFHFDNLSAAASQCIDIVETAVKHTGVKPEDIPTQLQEFASIRRNSLREIAGKFTPEEWKYLADSLNVTMITPEFRTLTAGLVASVEDSNHFDKLAEKWQVDTDTLIAKINKFTGAQVDAVYNRIQQFWNDPADLDSWAKY